MTGKLSFADFTKSILADMARIATRQASSALLSSLVGAATSYFTGGGGGNGLAAGSAGATSSNLGASSAGYSSIQVLEPGSEVLLFELDGTDYGADVLRFHGHAIPHTPAELIAAGVDADQLPAKAIYWQGNEYSAWPMQIDGIEANGDGTAVRPTLSVGNVNGRITALCLAFEDLLEFKLTMRHTLGTYLDAANFPAGNPTADPTQETIEVWYIDQKTNEDGENVSWELASPGDVGGESIGRQATTLCHWCLTGGYRGPNCGYTGPYVTKDGVVTDNPELDQCDATLGKGCIPRFGEGNPLPFGGFPAVSLIARS